MFEIKKFDLSSLAIISAIFYFILGLVIAIPVACSTVFLNSLESSNSTGFFGMFFSLLLPFFYAGIGTLINLIMGLIYNFIAQKWSGLKIELVKIEPLINKFAETKEV